MTITISIPDQLTQQAERRGVSVEAFVERALGDLAFDNSRPANMMTPEEAVADIRELRKGLTLGGVKIRDLINEGRKY